MQSFRACRTIGTGFWLATAIGCINPASNVAVAPGANLSALKVVAVWQFEDGGRASNSGAIATRALESALMAAGWRLLPYSRVREVAGVEWSQRAGTVLEAGMLTPALLRRLRDETGVDAILIGSVSDSWCDVTYVPPCWIESAFQLVDTRTGEIIASANVSDDGSSLQSAAKQMATKAAEKLTR